MPSPIAGGNGRKVALVTGASRGGQAIAVAAEVAEVDYDAVVGTNLRGTFDGMREAPAGVEATPHGEPR